MLARLLAGPPDPAVLALVAGLEGDATTEFGAAVEALAASAGKATTERVAREYHDLFIGVGRGELVPFASYYLTGFLNEKPLARLRGDMARLQIARAENVFEPEDHVAALAEMMAGLIEGAFGEAASEADQRRFFESHLAPWVGVFFEDLEGAKSADFYAAVGRLGRVFIEIERTALEMGVPAGAANGAEARPAVT